MARGECRQQRGYRTGRGRGFGEAALRRNKAGDMHTNCASKQTSTRRGTCPQQGKPSVGAATAVRLAEGGGNDAEGVGLNLGNSPRQAGRTGNIFINNNLFCVINNVGIVCFRYGQEGTESKPAMETETETETETSLL